MDRTCKLLEAAIAALILLIIVDAEQNDGQVSFFKAVGEFARDVAAGG